jgi:penicillin-binding protein 1C
VKIKLFKVLILLVILVSVVDGFGTVSNFKEKSGSIKFYDSQGALFYEYVNGLTGYQTPVPLSNYPKHIPELAVSTEDKRFYSHLGIDPLGMGRAVKENMAQGYVVSGASTITQQVSRRNLKKNKLLAGKLIRKVREINSALYLEILYSKEAILEDYLNNVYLGFNNYGVESATRYYFNKSSRDLSLSEGAVLIGMVKSPEVINPVTNYERSLQRRDEVLTLYARNEYIDAKKLAFEKTLPIGLNVTPRSASFLHFIDYALKESLEKLEKDTALDLKGYSIHTTLNSDLSTFSENVAKQKIDKIGKKNRVSNASVVILSPKDSALLVLMGSLDYFSEKIDGAVNVALAKRQPGSALKPITYAQAFYEEKLTPDSLINDEKHSFKDRKGRSYTPHNYNGVFNGPVPARVALASSLNLPAVKVLEMIGVESMTAAAGRLGIQTLNDADRYDLSVTLGGGEVTLLDMTNAYNSLARGGRYSPVYSVSRIQDVTGKEVYRTATSVPQAVWGDRSAEVAGTIKEILSNPNDKVLGFGRNNVLVLPFPAASKTGTTTDWHDNWTLGYTKDFTVGVWVGNSDNTPMAHIDGVTGAGPIWREVMLQSRDTLVPPNLVAPLEQKRAQSSPATVKNTVNTFAILNPPDGSVYRVSKDTSKFERIKFEFSMQEDLTSVEFNINGKDLAAISTANKSYLWTPYAGTFTLKAIGIKNGKSVEAVSTFTVTEEK